MIGIVKHQKTALRLGESNGVPIQKRTVSFKLKREYTHIGYDRYHLLANKYRGGRF